MSAISKMRVKTDRKGDTEWVHRILRIKQPPASLLPAQENQGAGSGELFFT